METIHGVAGGVLHAAKSTPIATPGLRSPSPLSVSCSEPRLCMGVLVGTGGLEFALRA